MSGPPAGGRAVPASVVRVVDGDTLVVVPRGRGRERVRVLGIDSPESVSPQVSPECWGPRASAWAMGLLHPGERVALRADPGQANRDRYGRALRYVTLPGGRDYSVLAAREGMAQPYVYHHDPVGEADRIAAAARQARHHDRGLWGPPCNGDVGPGTHPEAHGAHRGH